MIKMGVNDFVDKHGRRMSIEELSDFCKLHFDDFQFIDLISKYSQQKVALVKDASQHTNQVTLGQGQEENKESAKLENQYTTYVSPDKLNYLYDII